MKFWFHYNKPASRKAGRNILTLHFSGACHIVEAIDCRVPIKTRDRKTQPRCVMAGEATRIEIENGTAKICGQYADKTTPPGAIRAA